MAISDRYLTVLTDEQLLLIITGPNMGGKSTYLRQVALICIMAQCGSFVPAKKVSVPLLDRIFTRIGAGDNVAEGKSTFFVEMEETALICNYATKNSLVILDEVGRGTSTFDGLAIAQAVVEYIYQKIQARCLFATHYHELTALESHCPGIVSFHAASKKTKDGILLLYKIIKGAADGSFGLDVARTASLPKPVIERAQDILEQLANTTDTKNQSPFLIDKSDSIVQAVHENKQLQHQIMVLQKKLKQLEDRLTHLEAIDFNELSPKQAFDLLWQFKEG